MSRSPNALCAIVGPDFVMMAADTCHFSNQVVMLGKTRNKLAEVWDNVIMSSVGCAAAAAVLQDNVRRRHALHRIGTKVTPSTLAVANIAANFVAKELSERAEVFTLVAGFDADVGATLYRVDCRGSCVRLRKTATLGAAGQLAAAVMDKKWASDMTQDEAYHVLRRSVRQIQHRSSANLPRFSVAVVDAAGRRDLPPFSVERLAQEKMALDRAPF